MQRRIRIGLFFLLLATLIGGLMLVLFAPFELKSIGILMLLFGAFVFAVLVTAFSRSYEQETGDVIPIPERFEPPSHAVELRRDAWSGLDA
jgi:membrane protein implicated in regulation of membrane protease activity